MVRGVPGLRQRVGCQLRCRQTCLVVGFQLLASSRNSHAAAVPGAGAWCRQGQGPCRPEPPHKQRQLDRGPGDVEGGAELQESHGIYLGWAGRENRHELGHQLQPAPAGPVSILLQRVILAPPLAALCASPPLCHAGGAASQQCEGRTAIILKRPKRIRRVLWMLRSLPSCGHSREATEFVRLPLIPAA